MSADVLGLCGSTLDGIRVEACVDTGGTSLVYRGLNVARSEPVALKILRLSQVGSDVGAQNALVGRFRDETKIIQHLSHGTHDIVKCFGTGEAFAPATGEKVYYTVVEWLDGRTLAVDLDERRRQGLRGRAFSEALDLMESAALALAHAHSQGIVHRDITPANLFLARTRGGGLRLKVLDFGVAKILADDIQHRKVGFEQSVKTMTGTTLCSPSYGAPEQFNPRLGAIGPSTDVYSLTLVLLEVVLGDQIRKVNTVAEAVVKALDPNTGSPRPSRLGIPLPPMIDDLLTRALAQNPLERPQNAGVFWSSLRELTRLVAQPVRDPMALAPTAIAGEVADAILRVRAQVSQMESAQQQQKADPLPPPSPTDNPMAFHGTVVMKPVPGLPPLNSQPLHHPQSDGQTATAPIAMPHVPQVRIPPAKAGATPAIALPTSPLASSLVQAMPTPPMRAQQQPQQQAPLPKPASSPALPRQQTRIPLVLAAAILLAVLAIGIGLIWFFRRHHH